ncbi:MAG: threonine synthase [Oscillospiraceae bacterium]|nr:threonine synthase [Oscillospiraceae bacterium]
MQYQSTRGASPAVAAAGAISRGICPDGGLYVPDTIPRLSQEAIAGLTGASYSERAAAILGYYLDDFSKEEIELVANKAYGGAAFSDGGVAPLRRLNAATSFMELWHGPTCAFKDVALQALPSLLAMSLRKINEPRKACVLTATSGDTGKAALEGFRDAPNAGIFVFYPRDGVSEIQKLQMTSQEGSNVGVMAVEGNFDDAQTGVKAIFADEGLRAQLDAAGYFLSSANSINCGRLLPQIAYYVSAYCDMITSGELKPGEELVFAVPTGNFGNILAAWYAGEMGVPIRRLVCASNKNDVLTQFINTGVYDSNRPFYSTVSPSMDILVSSNLERLLFELSDKDSGAVSEYMRALSGTGRYEVADSVKSRLLGAFYGGYCTEEDTKSTIAETFRNNGYLIDTHTAVAYKVLRDYREANGDGTPAVVVSTASPFKFCGSVLDALGVAHGPDGVDLIEELARATGCPVPAPLARLGEKQPRFTGCVPVGAMAGAVRDFLQLR